MRSPESPAYAINDSFNGEKSVNVFESDKSSGLNGEFKVSELTNKATKSFTKLNNTKVLDSFKTTWEPFVSSEPTKQEPQYVVMSKNTLSHSPVSIVSGLRSDVSINNKQVDDRLSVLQKLSQSMSESDTMKSLLLYQFVTGVRLQQYAATKEVRSSTATPVRRMFYKPICFVNIIY